MESTFSPGTHSDAAVLLIGQIDREGIVSSLKATGRRYVIKRIDSKPENWETICERFESERIDCALVQLTSTTYSYLDDPKYLAIRDRLLTHIAGVRHAVFAYESLIHGAEPIPPQETPITGQLPDEFHAEYFSLPPEETRARVNELLSGLGLRVLPYRTNAELTMLAWSLLEEMENGLLLRVYVPSKRIWADETDRLLTLFRDYLSKIGHEEISLHQRRTEHGVVYEFFSAQGRQGAIQSSTALSTEFRDFSYFLDLCLSAPSEAESVLRGKNVDVHEIASMLTRYAKEARRLHVDLKHEREQRVLSIRQRLESDLVDVVPVETRSEDLMRLVDAAVPPIAGIGMALTAEAQPIRVISSGTGAITVNFNPQTVHAVNSVVARDIAGDVHLNQNDQRLLELIREHAPDRQVELASAVRELADDSAPKQARLLSRQRLKAFLFSVASKLPDVALGVLQSYLEKRLGL